MFRNKLIKKLSIGVISLSLLAGIGIASNNINIHADTDPYSPAAIAKDDAEANAAGDQEGAKEDTLNPDMRNIDEEGASWNSNDDIVKMSNEIFNSPNFVKGSKANQKKDQKFLRKYFKRTSNGKLVRVNHHKKSQRISKHSKRSHRINHSHRKSRKHIRRNKKQRKHLSRKSVSRLNKQLRNDKRLLRSKKAKRNYKYRRNIIKNMKKLNRVLKDNRK